MEKIALLGMMASGKTTLGKMLSKRLSVPLADSDEEIERAAGMTIPEIFLRHGEGEFRRLERRVLEELLDRPGSLLIAMGGGAYVQDDIRDLLRGRAVSVYLRVQPDELIRRLEKTNVAMRPLLAAGDDWRDSARNIVAAREPRYMEADVIFPAGNHGIPELGERLANVLLHLCRCKFEPAGVETANA